MCAGTAERCPPDETNRRPVIRQYELVDRVRAYDPNADEGVLNRAYVFSMVRHGAQTRASGDPYFSHPLEVAGILTDLRLDAASIVTALLHDTVEDGVASESEITSYFGDEIARLVDGVTKLSKLSYRGNPTRRQAENFRKLLVAMSEDIRVLLVKLADRLHNMRTLGHINNPDKRRRIASETMEIYAPLAERIGMQTLKDELEDLSFAELNPDARRSISRRLEFLRESEGARIPEIVAELKATLASAGIEARVYGREKRPFSIWRKMERKHIPFEQIADVMAFRVVVPSVPECYQALGVVHRAYPMVPGRFKDFMSTPKPNGYESLHTAVIGPQRRRIEIQIRDQEQHEIAEFGVAAHWIYKHADSGAALKDGRKYRWLRELLEILDHTAGPEEFLEHTKLEMYQDQVFCFTPKGDLIALPHGATPVDFAYAVHSDVGDTCVGAKINGRVAPLRTALSNGDQVEILVSDGQTPDPNWERFVVTGKARARIRRSVRKREAAEYASLGEAILAKTLSQHDQELKSELVRPHLKSFKVRSLRALYGLVGRGQLDPDAVYETLFPSARPAAHRKSGNGPFRPSKSHDPSSGGLAVPIRGLTPGMALHLADCCHPLPGDRIVGLVTEGKGVTIHTIDCETLESFAATPERWLDVAWNPSGHQAEMYTGRIETVLNNVPGSLNALTEVIAQSQGNISNLRVTHRSQEFFEMAVDVEVADLKHLTAIIAALRANPSIYQVQRANP